MCMYVCVCMCVYVFMHVGMYVCVCMYVCMYFFIYFINNMLHYRVILHVPGTVVAQWLRCRATNRKVAGSIPDGVIGIFH